MKKASLSLIVDGKKRLGVEGTVEDSNDELRGVPIKLNDEYMEVNWSPVQNYDNKSKVDDEDICPIPKKCERLLYLATHYFPDKSYDLRIKVKEA